MYISSFINYQSTLLVNYPRLPTWAKNGKQQHTASSFIARWVIGSLMIILFVWFFITVAVTPKVANTIAIPVDSPPFTIHHASPHSNNNNPSPLTTITTTKQKITASMHSLSESNLSNLSSPPSPNHLHGGWPFTIYNHSLSSSTSHHPPNKTKVISYDSPRIVLFKDFLSKDEISHLISISKDMERSEVVADDREQDESRTSFGAWLNGPRRDGRVRLIQHRIHQLVGIPEEFGESLYVLRYAIGQRYEAHADQCSTGLTVPRKEGEKDPAAALPESCVGFLKRAGGLKCGGPPGGGVTCGDRLATVILTLNAATEGGATVFPRLKARQNLLLSNSNSSSNNSIRGGVGVAEEDIFKTKMANIQKKRPFLDDESGGTTNTTTTTTTATLDIPWYCKEDADVLSVKTEPGDALLFWGYSPSDLPGGLGVQEYGSVHAGCPPTRGVKLIATRWIRSAEFH